MFDGDLNLHNYAKTALPDRVMGHCYPILVNDDEDLAATNHWQRQATMHSRTESLISMIRVGVACSVESPKDRMTITDVVNELQSDRNILLS